MHNCCTFAGKINSNTAASQPPSGSLLNIFCWMSESKRNTAILLLLFTGVLMGALDISIVGPAIPSIEKTIQIPERDLGWIYSIYILFNLVGISLMAKLSDTFGRRWVYVAAVAVFGTGSLMVALSADFGWLLAGRAVQGFGSSGVFPVAIAVVGDIFPVEKRGRSLGLIGAVFGFAFMLGPFLAGFMLRYFDWNALFLINIPVALLIMILAAVLLPSQGVGKRAVIDWPGIIMIGIILSAFTLALNNLDPAQIAVSLGSWQVLPFLLLTVLLTPLLLMMEAHQPDPVLNVALFRSKQVRIVGFVAFGLGLFQSSIVFLPKFSVEQFSVDPPTASFMLLPVVMATAVGSPLLGRLNDRFGSRSVIVAGLLIASVALLLLGFPSRDTSVYYLAGAFLGFGLAIRPSLSYIMLNEVSRTDRASTQGILLIFISVGQLAGAALIGAIAATRAGNPAGYRISFLLMGVLSLVLAFTGLLLRSKHSELAEGAGD